MIHEIAPHYFDNQYGNHLPEPESFALYYKDNLSLVKKTSQGIEFPKFKDLEKSNGELYKNATYLFSIDRQRYYLIDEISLAKIDFFSLEKIEIFRHSTYQMEAYAGITGHQLYNWYCSNKYCGCCGEGLEKDVKERMLRCNKCGNMVFPRLNPAVIVGVTHKNRILLSRYNGQAKGTYALVAGFIEVGESLEEGVKREVLEEVGLHVTNIRYYKSQPWPFTSSLLMGFYCDVVGGGESIVLDTEELCLAQWFEREEIPVKPNTISLTNEMIIAFKNGEV